jgi:hypothetical protein
MNRRRILVLATSTLALVATMGCSHPYYPPAGPPPPPPPVQPAPLIQTADHNGYQNGRADGSRDVYAGYPFAPRRTRAYHETPGYDANLGPFHPYQNAFRNAYLRGYQDGYYRR